MFVKSLFLILPFYAFAVYCYKKPDKPCEATDEACVNKASADFFIAAIVGDSNEGLESLDPMHHDVITANLQTVNFTLKDCTVVGFKDLKVLSAKVSTHDSLYLSFLLPRYEMSGKYELTGNFQNTPIQGHGNFKVSATDIKVDLEAMKHYYRKDGKIYFKIKTYIVNNTELGTMHLDADNLIDGNKELSDATLQLLNSNYKVTAAVWNAPITMANMDKFFDNVNKILVSVPMTDLVQNYTPKEISDNE